MMKHTVWSAVALSALLLSGCGGDSGDRTAGAKDATPSILMVVTGHGRMGEGEPTGLWFEEFAIPYRLFREQGYEVTVATPEGGKAPIDPRSLEGEKTPDKEAFQALEATRALPSVDLAIYDAVFFPGGHGTMFDFPENDAVGKAVSHFMTEDKPAAFVCHGPAALVGATGPDGTPVVKGRRITSFTDSEERAVELEDDVPFLLESRLRELGATFFGTNDFAGHVVVDGNLVTGQNPASSEEAALRMIELLADAPE